MNIKAAINNIYNLGASGKAQKESPAKPETSKSRPTGGHEKMDRITISTQGSKQRDAAVIARQVMTEIGSRDNSSRIEEIRHAIKSGEYNVSSRQVADAILSRINL